MDAKQDGKEKPVEVRGSPTRCPYCHDEASADRDVWVCQDCLARHHAECWRERGACSTCASTRHLEPPARAPLTPERARETLVAAGFKTAEVERVLSPSTVHVQAPREAGPPKMAVVAVAVMMILFFAFPLVVMVMSGKGL